MAKRKKNRKATPKRVGKSGASGRASARRKAASRAKARPKNRPPPPPPRGRGPGRSSQVSPRVRSQPARGRGAPQQPAHKSQQHVPAEDLINLENSADDALLAPRNLPPFVIVGVGASAGGLEALSQVLQNLSQDVDFAVVLVQHLAPDHESFLPELLAGSTPLSVVQAADQMKLEPGQVYVAPPGVQVEIVDEKLHLVPRPHDSSRHMPIDHFFRSLSEYAQNRAIGVVLSGTGSDGSMGLRDVKAAGGIALVQEPTSARFDAMPRAAIATGVADMILAPHDISRELPRIATTAMIEDHAHFTRETIAPEDHQLQRIFTSLRNASGVDFSHYKLPTIRRRLQRRLVLHKLETIDEYVRFLQRNPVEIQALYQDLLIHVTRFFRDPESYVALAQRVFPEIVAHRAAGDNPIRIWIPGCSTGEEAYSIAIALIEFLGENAAGIPIQIFATDVSEAAVERARSGIYPENISADVSADRLRRFFSRVDGSYRISKQIRDLCIFARQDLTRDPPFSKLDLIVCRNVLIYLGPVLQRRLMTVFHYALKTKGHLILGNAETIGTHADLFSIVDKRQKIYVKKSAISRVDIEFPLHLHVARTAELPEKHDRDARRASTIQNEANRIILSRYAPPAVLVGSDLKILQFRGQTGAFLEPAPGDASLDLLKMAREGLLYALRSAIAEARNSGGPVRKSGLRIKQNGNVHEAAVEVVPISGEKQSDHFLILFERADGRSTRDVAARAAPQPQGKKRGKRARSAAADRERLEQELVASREYLQSMIQDLEAANEELQSANEETLSANEELQSTNEELDTAKEELQSTNEELNTVNEELQGRNEELSRVNSDLLNLLGSVQIAIVMVTNDLRIRRFTPMAEKVLNLIPTDIGRPIGDIKPNIDCRDLEPLITEAIDSVSIKERECHDRYGKLYILRIRPYKNTENRIDGAVLALFDVEQATGRVAAAATTAAAAGSMTSFDRSAREPIEAVMMTVGQPMLLLDERDRVLAASPAMMRLLGDSPSRSDGNDGDSASPDGQASEGNGGLDRQQYIGQSVFSLGGGRLDCPQLRQLLGRLPIEGVLRQHRVQLTASSAESSRTLVVHARRVGGDGRPPLNVLAFELE